MWIISIIMKIRMINIILKVETRGRVASQGRIFDMLRSVHHEKENRT